MPGPEAGFTRIEGTLHAGDVSLAMLADRVGTPAFIYDAGQLRARARALKTALAGQDVRIFYAMKANNNPAVLRILADEGIGADIVSGGEMRFALAAGIRAENIVFSGVGKTETELRDALDEGIFRINAESVEELETLERLASQAGRNVKVGLRVNPDVDADTHHKITTGKAENKFGIAMADVPALAARILGLAHIHLGGLAVHIGSQLTSLSPFRKAWARLVRMADDLKAAGHPLDRLDLGGGLGITYRDEAPPDFAAFGQAIAETVTQPGWSAMIEPGRSLVASCGVLLARVIRVKHGHARKFLILDAGMNDLLRPALYDAWHEIVPVGPPRKGRETYDIVGPVCETGDSFATARELPEMREGDAVAILSAGAYGAVMGSTYNARPLAPEILVDGSNWHITRARPEIAGMIATYSLPDWL